MKGIAQEALHFIIKMLMPLMPLMLLCTLFFRCCTCEQKKIWILEALKRRNVERMLRIKQLNRTEPRQTKQRRRAIMRCAYLKPVVISIAPLKLPIFQHDNAALSKQPNAAFCSCGDGWDIIKWVTHEHTCAHKKQQKKNPCKLVFVMLFPKQINTFSQMVFHLYKN